MVRRWANECSTLTTYTSEMTDYADELRAAAHKYRELEERVADHDGDVEAAAEAYRRFAGLLDSSEDEATGSGFEAYVQFQEAVAGLVEALDDDVAAKDAFEAADDTLHQRRLSSSDFEQARDDLRPARDCAELVDARESAADEYTRAVRAARTRLRELEDEIERLERLRELGKADLDAPVERLREPVEAYDDAVRDAFATFRREAPAREVFDLVEYAGSFPLVEWREPPPRLTEYVRESEAGEESITTLLEYADYTVSKLSHYIDDPGALKRHVATNRTYLQGLSADAVTVGWPPPKADRLRFLCREFAPVVRRFADEPTQARLREVRALPDRGDYERLRRAAIAREELTANQRERVASGAVETDLEAAREERSNIKAALEKFPGPK